MEEAEIIGLDIEVILDDHVDTVLKTKDLVVSGDSIILNECTAWYNLTERVIKDSLGDYPYIKII